MPHDQTVYFTDEEYNFVDELTDRSDPDKPSFSGYIRGLVQEDMEERDAA